MSDNDQIAAFIAARGVKRIDEGASNGYRNRDWRRAVRGEMPRDPTQERRLAAVDHAGHEFWVNGLGERIT